MGGFGSRGGLRFDCAGFGSRGGQREPIAPSKEEAGQKPQETVPPIQAPTTMPSSAK